MGPRYRFGKAAASGSACCYESSYSRKSCTDTYRKAKISTS